MQAGQASHCWLQTAANCWRLFWRTENPGGSELTTGVDIALEAHMFSLLPGDDLRVGARPFSTLSPLSPLSLVTEDNVAEQDENYRYPCHLVAELLPTLYFNTSGPAGWGWSQHRRNNWPFRNISLQNYYFQYFYWKISKLILAQSENMNNFIIKFCSI